jgi:2-octaprenyl-6-methoxyphenol hydroxylase
MKTLAAGDDFDLAIVGGGMVGASLAVALLPLGLRLALIESVPFGAASQPSFDERTTALSNGSRRILTGMGIWPDIVGEAMPIRRVHVSDQGRFGFARLEAREQGVEALGFVVPNRVLGAALWRRLEANASCAVLAPARVVDIQTGPQHVELRIAANGEAPRTIKSRLVVVADGAQSTIRAALGVEATIWDYGQTAIIANVETQRDHENVAYERFTPTGPMALLPVRERCCAAIWTLAPETAAETLKLDDAQFLAALQDKFGFRMGRFLRVGKRSAYPLSLTRAQERVGTRVVIIGNAAQGLHPIAGQGFNLGLRDVATLADVIAEDREHIGEREPLARYDEWRRRDRRTVIAFTDGLVRLFGNPLLPIKMVRDIGLLLFDLTPPAKDTLAALSMGVAGRLPRLARGGELT